MCTSVLPACMCVRLGMLSSHHVGAGGGTWGLCYNRRALGSGSAAADPLHPRKAICTLRKQSLPRSVACVTVIPRVLSFFKIFLRFILCVNQS